MGKVVTARAKTNARQRMDGLEMLAQVPDRAAAAAFLDPQYRDVLDGLRFGNEGARQRGRARLPQMSRETIQRFVEQLERVVRPGGHLFLWVDKYAIANGAYRPWFKRSLKFHTVGLIVWDKLRLGMGRRERYVSEFLLVIQKAPLRAKGVWSDRRIPDVWPEQADRSGHPHAKPYQLTDRLIRSVTKRGDLVVDPCAGSYVVLEACVRSGRTFIGCDIAEHD